MLCDGHTSSLNLPRRVFFLPDPYKSVWFQVSTLGGGERDHEVVGWPVGKVVQWQRLRDTPFRSDQTRNRDVGE